MIARPVVLLPQPDSPTSPSVSPLRRVNVIPSTARTSPMWRSKRMPSVIGNQTRTSSTWSSGPGLRGRRRRPRRRPSRSRVDRRAAAARRLIGPSIRRLRLDRQPGGRRRRRDRRRSSTGRLVDQSRPPRPRRRPSSSTTLAPGWSSTRRRRRLEPVAERPPGRGLLGRRRVVAGDPVAGLGTGRHDRPVRRERDERGVRRPADARAARRSAARTGSRPAPGACPGGRPSIGISSSPSTASSRGIEWSSPTVYGCDGPREQVRRSWPSRR